MKLRILAPFRSHFRLSLAFAVRTGQLSVLPADYLDFWNRAQQHVDANTGGAPTCEANEVRFLHGNAFLLGSDEPRFTRIDTDAVRYTTEIIELRPTRTPALADADLLAIIKDLGARRQAGMRAFNALASQLAIDSGSVRIRVFDNTISLLQADLDITEPIAQALADGANTNADTTRAEYLDMLREFAVFLGESLVLFYYQDSVFPLLDWLGAGQQQDHRVVDALHIDDETIERLNDHGDTFRYPLARLGAKRSAKPEVLWVTRSLICEAGDADRVELTAVVATWLKDIGETRQAAEAASNPDTYCARWLNYVFREDFVASSAFNDVWEGIMLCQYTYSALDALNDRLNGVISISNRTAKDVHVHSLHEALDETVQRTAILLLNYNETQNYMNRSKLAAVRSIMDYWEFDRFERTTREKMTVCRERLEDLHRKSAEKSSRYTELLLFGIGLLAILDLGIGLAMYGRAPAESTFVQDERHTGFILAFLASLPASAIILFSIAAVVGLIVFYLKLRNKKRIL